MPNLVHNPYPNPLLTEFTKEYTVVNGNNGEFTFEFGFQAGSYELSQIELEVFTATRLTVNDKLVITLPASDSGVQDWFANDALGIALAGLGASGSFVGSLKVGKWTLTLPGDVVDSLPITDGTPTILLPEGNVVVNVEVQAVDPKTERFTIIGVTTGLGGTFTVKGNWLTRFVAAQAFDVANSTGNDASYSVDSSALVNGNTVITVNETVVNSTVDGIVVHPDPDLYFYGDNAAVVDVLFDNTFIKAPLRDVVPGVFEPVQVLDDTDPANVYVLLLNKLSPELIQLANTLITGGVGATDKAKLLSTSKGVIQFTKFIALDTNALSKTGIAGKSGTPTASTVGYLGEIWFDSNFIYVNVDGGVTWMKAALVAL